jgi:serine-type D-Ala-D-Ala carboxypeptidase (penicillin-binding protein 5/6)
VIRRALACVALATLLIATPAVAGAPLAAEPVASPGLVPPPEVGVEDPPEVWAEPPPLGASAALLVVADTGQVLAAIDPDTLVPVASTIKTLTALTVLRRSEPEDLVTAGEEVAGVPFDGANVGIEEGDTWSVEDLIAALIARSGNDAALVLAEHVGGGVEGLLALMREDAESLGVAGGRIETVHGLGDLDRLSARDLGVIGRAAMADPDFAAVASQTAVTLPGIGRILSRNDLLATYPGADGVKTGYTAVAGRTLIASATREGHRLIAVVLGSADPVGHFDDATLLLDHGFDRFTVVPVGGEDPAAEVRRPGRWIGLHAPDGAAIHVPSEAALGPTRHLDLPAETDAVDDALLTFRWGDDDLAHLELTAGGEVGGAPTVPGAWIVDRAYAAMRAVTAADAWPEDDS